MQDELRLSALGASVTVLAPPLLRDRLASQWARCQASEAAYDARPVLVELPAWSGEIDERDVIEYTLASRVTYLGIREQTGRRLMLHAAGLADPETSRTAVLVAASGTGKTTAAARLGQRFGYVTDENVSLDADLTVLPYPKPLSVVIAAEDPLHKSQHGPDELGLLPCPPSPTAGLIVLLSRDGSVEPVLEPVAPMDALLELIPQTSALPSLERPLQRLVELLAQTGGAGRLRYREIDAAGDLLAEALAASAPVDLGARAHPPVAQPDDLYGEVAAEPGGDIRADAVLIRGAYVDAVEIEGEVLVLVGATPVRLSGLGASLWLASAEPQSLGDLVEVCRVEHGEHPDAESLVRDAVQSLQSYGLLTPHAGQR